MNFGITDSNAALGLSQRLISTFWRVLTTKLSALVGNEVEGEADALSTGKMPMPREMMRFWTGKMPILGKELANPAPNHLNLHPD